MEPKFTHTELQLLKLLLYDYMLELAPEDKEEIALVESVAEKFKKYFKSTEDTKQ